MAQMESTGLDESGDINDLPDRVVVGVFWLVEVLPDLEMSPISV